MKRKNNLVLLSAVLIGITLISACGGRGQGAEEEDKAVSVLVETATNGTLNKYLELSGTLKARNEVEIYPDVTGKISYINKFEGEYVWAGQAIAYIDRFQVGANYALSPIKSPVSGYVTSLYMVKGQSVMMSVPVAKVGNIEIIDVNINIPEPNVTDVEVGQDVYLTVPAYPDKVFEGEIYRKDYAINSVNRSLLVRAEFENDAIELLPGMYGDVSVFIDSVEDAIILPINAVFEEEEDEYYVYLNITNTAQLRPVEILLQTSEAVAVSGIEPGDEVVTFGREFLEADTPIRPIYEDVLDDDKEAMTNDPGSADEAIYERTPETLGTTGEE